MLARAGGKSPDQREPSKTGSVLLNAQEYEAKASDNDQEPEFEVLPAVKEFVPGPDTLGDGHGDGLDCNEEKEDATEAHGGACSLKKCAEGSSREDGEMDHAVSIRF